MSKIIEGNLPLIVENQNTEKIKNYQIYGTADGAGVETENLFVGYVGPFDLFIVDGVLTVTTSRRGNVFLYAPVEKDQTYCVTGLKNHWENGAFFDHIPQVGDVPYNNEYAAFSSRGNVGDVGASVFTAPIDGYFIYSDLASYRKMNMLSKGSTPLNFPFIPYGYKLPMTVTSGAQSTTTPIYIGDSKLGAEEYVDYGEQKIYKRSKNYLKTHEDGDEIIRGITWTTNSKDGTVTANGTATFESLYGIAFKCPEDVPPGNYYYSGCPAGGTQNSVYNVYDWDATHSRHCPNWSGTITSINCYNNSEVPIKLDSGLSLFVTCRVYRGITVNNLVFRPMLRAADSEAGFESYLAPTDPPVTLPELSLYKGTNTLSSTAELGKVILDYPVPEISKIQLENQLYDLIDKNFYNIIANSYSSSLTYNEGDYCIYNYQLYKCISAISIPEDFDSEKWSQVTLAESLRGD